MDTHQVWIMGFLFLSSRRRHTRCYRDWSSDVCSSDLLPPGPGAALLLAEALDRLGRGTEAARSEERREGKSVDLGGRRIITKKKKTPKKENRAHAGRTGILQVNQASSNIS